MPLEVRSYDLFRLMKLSMCDMLLLDGGRLITILIATVLFAFLGNVW